MPESIIDKSLDLMDIDFVLPFLLFNANTNTLKWKKIVSAR